MNLEKIPWRKITIKAILNTNSLPVDLQISNLKRYSIIYKKLAHNKVFKESIRIISNLIIYSWHTLPLKHECTKTTKTWNVWEYKWVVPKITKVTKNWMNRNFLNRVNKIGIVFCGNAIIGNQTHNSHFQWNRTQ